MSMVHNLKNLYVRKRGCDEFDFTMLMCYFTGYSSTVPPDFASHRSLCPSNSACSYGSCLFIMVLILPHQTNCIQYRRLRRSKIALAVMTTCKIQWRRLRQPCTHATLATKYKQRSQIFSLNTEYGTQNTRQNTLASCRPVH